MRKTIQYLTLFLLLMTDPVPAGAQKFGNMAPAPPMG